MKSQTLVLVSGIIALIAMTTTEAREIVRRSVQQAAMPPIKEGRVIGGEMTTADQAPYQVSIQNTYGEHVCGGSIIDKYYVLTAGHCMNWPKEYLKIVTGATNWTQPDAEYLVQDIKVHCLHDKPMYHNDIALIRLTKPIKFNKRTQPIKLSTKNSLKAGDNLILTGWGSTKLWGRTPDILQKVVLQFVEHDNCKRTVRNSAWVGDDHMCSSTKTGEGSCHGDSGGPLINENKELVGVVNFGDPCANGYPDCYADVAYFYDWIRTTMSGTMTGKC